MSRIQIPVELLTSRFNLGDRFASMRSGSLASRFSNMRPLSEFFDVKRINKPANFPEMQSRINYNLGYYSSNYAVVFSMLCIYSLLTNFWLLFDIVFVSVGMFIIGKLEGRDLEFGEQRFSTVQLYTGLYVIAIPIALISGVFGMMMWLIGGLGGRPRAPKPAPQWGRPSRRERRNEARNGEEERWWDFGQRVEELDSEGDFDTQGVGSTSTALTRRVTSDSLRFTGMDMGDGVGNTRSRKAYAYQNGEDDDTTDNSEEGSDGEDGVRMALVDPEEEALADAAMARIRKAHAKGRQDVKLSKEELAAYQRRLQRMEDEGRRQRRDQRVAIPISQLGPGPQRQSVEDDSPPPSQQLSPEPGAERQEPSPANGVFLAPFLAQPHSPRAHLISTRRAGVPLTETRAHRHSHIPMCAAISRPILASLPIRQVVGRFPLPSRPGARLCENQHRRRGRTFTPSYGSGPAGGPSRRHSGGPREARIVRRGR
ncbi:hypothetical protein CHGG_01110 [Chaetomium globosum CBS 148.51]|uniref:PRA1 family protein n=1 Tax=Chaetomium globosum (strain ATCC 6205 / CBS 148.51 / DSM 1962 / NBRC 6347 / NRRL 1970) TaxID=306901 RepID=Q2HF94_CHAGB|nr:uncharacterized protein CHGG_01110 [Chaetomium globosum CBS 148.51]EAQ92875.1 hypothetical protein CHGG_01110 [Chaetomium globosum CBS 148.51]